MFLQVSQPLNFTKAPVRREVYLAKGERKASFEAGPQPGEVPPYLVANQ
jgi:hypothetical protein